MSLSESIRQLEEQVRRTVESAMEGVRDQLLERLQQQNQHLQEQVRSLDVELPEGVLSGSQLQDWLDDVVARVQPSSPPVPGAQALHQGVGAIDQARSQSQVLQALLSQSEAFADRAAVFLVQPERLQGWGGRGFGEGDAALKQVGLAASPGTAWARLLDGEGVVSLGSVERAGLASQLEAPVGQEAVLIPLVLRNRVAGALYADRVEMSGSLAGQGLQILTYVAALALETLPLRDRPATATLRLAGGTGAPEAPAEPSPAVEAEPPPAVGEVPAPPADDGEPPIPAAPAATTTTAPEPTPEAAPPPPPVPGEESLPAPGETAPPEVAEESPALQDVQVEESEELDAGELEVEDLEDEVEIDLDADMDAELGTDPGPGLAAPEAEAPEPPAVTAEGPEVEGRSAEAAGTDAQAAGFQVEEEPPQPSAPPAAPVPASDEDTRPGTEPKGDGAAQVAPPSDVQGPGWAFGGGGGEERDGDEEARHDEARRLARLLVSEIKLYNEDQVLEGRRSQDIFERLKEDIEKSRQLYESRVDDRVRESTDYFYQEMVRVLGAGDPKTLGI